MLRVEGDGPVGLDCERGLDRLAHYLFELDRLTLERPSLVEARQEEQVVHEQAHPLRLAADALHRARKVVRPPVGAAREQLGIRAYRGQRRPQLVRGVGHEAAQLLLGGCPRFERGLDLAEHRVQREPKPPDLRVRLGPLHAPREIAARDRRRRRADRAQRTKPDAHGPKAECG